MTRFQKIGIILLLLGAVAGGGYIAVSNRKTGKRWRLLPTTMKRFVNAVEREAKRQGMSVMFWDGWRDPADTIANIQAGTTKVKDPYGSLHTWGGAADIVFRNRLGFPSWPDRKTAAGMRQWQRLGAIGKKLGMKWGGDWSWFDGAHFYKSGVSVAALKRSYGTNYQSYLKVLGVTVA